MAAAAPCPEESTVWSFVHADLSPPESAAIRAHLDECAACRATTAMLARSLPAPADTDATELDEGLSSQMDRLSAHIARDQIVAGKYRVEERLGSGGMGYVVAALHQQLGTRVALKILHPRMMQEADARARFLREARVVARLKSPHVVRVFDVDTLDEAPFLVMELLEGNDLAAELRERGTIPAPEAILYVLQAAHALAEAHRNGIVHRDLKPANMFLVRDGDARALKLLDFGISKELGRSSWAEISSSRLAIIGTPRYMAPEQLTLGGTVDARTDVWGLGVVLYQLITGSLPFPAESIHSYVAGVLTGEPVPIADAPRGLWSVIGRCLSKDPAARYASIDDLAEALAPFAPEVVTAAPTRSRKRIAFATAVAVMILAATALVVRRAGREEIVAAPSAPLDTSPLAAPAPPPPPEASQPAPLPPPAARASPAAPRGTRPAPHAEYGSRR